MINLAVDGDIRNIARDCNKVIMKEGDTNKSIQLLRCKVISLVDTATHLLMMNKAAMDSVRLLKKPILEEQMKLPAPSSCTTSSTKLDTKLGWLTERYY